MSFIIHSTYLRESRSDYQVYERLAVVGGQVLIVQVGGPAFQVVPIGWRDWVVSIILGALSLPVAVLIRLLPPGPFERFMYRYNLYPDPNAPRPSTTSESDSDEEKEEWNEGKYPFSI
jgi:Ca2+-transporting ATPase